MLTIRILRKEDVKATFEVLKKSFQRVTASEESFSHSMSVIFVAELDGKIVGTVSVTVTALFSYIDDLAVLPEYRQQGIARKLMEAAVRVGEENSREIYGVCASQYSARIFKRLGFKHEQQGKYVKKVLAKVP